MAWHVRGSRARECSRRSPRHRRSHVQADDIRCITSGRTTHLRTSAFQPPEVPSGYRWSGDPIDGKEITLLDLETGFQLGPGWSGNEEWSCTFAIDGRLDVDHPLTFESVQCELTHLSAWLDAPVPREKMLLPARGIEVAAGATTLAEIDLDDASVELVTGLGTQRGFDNLFLPRSDRRATTRSKRPTVSHSSRRACNRRCD